MSQTAEKIKTDLKKNLSIESLDDTEVNEQDFIEKSSDVGPKSQRFFAEIGSVKNEIKYKEEQNVSRAQSAASEHQPLSSINNGVQEERDKKDYKVKLQIIISKYEQLMQQISDSTDTPKSAKDKDFYNSLISILPCVCFERAVVSPQIRRINVLTDRISKDCMSNNLSKLAQVYSSFSINEVFQFELDGILDGIEAAEKTAHIMIILTLLLNPLYDIYRWRTYRDRDWEMRIKLINIVNICVKFQNIIDFSYGSSYQLPDNIQTAFLTVYIYYSKIFDSDLLPLFLKCNFPFSDKAIEDFLYEGYKNDLLAKNGLLRTPNTIGLFVYHNYYTGPVYQYKSQAQSFALDVISNGGKNILQRHSQIVLALLGLLHNDLIAMVLTYFEPVNQNHLLNCEKSMHYFVPAKNYDRRLFFCFYFSSNHFNYSS